MLALETRDVTYRRSGLTVVQRVSLYSDHGELLALLGPGGSGVNTLLRLLAGELDPDAGRVLVEGRDPRWTDPATRRRDPRRLAHGPEAAARLLADPGNASILLLDRPTVGLDGGPAADLMDACRRRADEGFAVVATLDRVDQAAVRAHAIAVLVAGRLVSWGDPSVALFPALHILSYRGSMRVGSPASAPAGT